MSFDGTKISDLTSSMQYLISSMIDAGKYMSRAELLSAKPNWLAQTERFSSLFDRIKEDKEAVEKFKNKVLYPMYLRYNIDLNNKLIDDEDKVQDAYIKIKINKNEDFKLKTKPEGIHFFWDPFFLPISEAYSRVLAFETKNKEQNNMHATCILIGLYSVLYHAAFSKEDKEVLKGLNENIKLLVSALDIMVKPAPRSFGGPMDMLKNLMQNMDLEPIEEMMSTITGDSKAKGSLGEVLKRMGKTVEEGGNPLDQISEMMNEFTAQAAASKDAEDVDTEETVVEDKEEVKALETVEEVEEVKEVEEEPHKLIELN